MSASPKERAKVQRNRLMMGATSLDQLMAAPANLG
jgi:hypothetical protein